MRVAVFDTHSYDHDALNAANDRHTHDLVFLEPRLTTVTVPLARDFKVVCSFVNDHVDALTLEGLQACGVRLIALRCAGFNHVDLTAAAKCGIRVVRVPEYSPYAVAEHAFALILSLNRKIHHAYNRVRELNFRIDGLVGFDLHDKTLGIIGTGRIGSTLARIARGFGMHIVAYDVNPSSTLAGECGVEYVSLAELFRTSDIISLHAPLRAESHHMIGESAFNSMKKGVLVINTSRGGLVDARALVMALKSGRVGAAGLDVYEEEEGIFSNDLSEKVLQDDLLARLLSFPNVLITSHQGFLTHEALHNIAETTLANISAFERGRALTNEIAH